MGAASWQVPKLAEELEDAAVREDEADIAVCIELLCTALERLRTETERRVRGDCGSTSPPASMPTPTPTSVMTAEGGGATEETSERGCEKAATEGDLDGVGVGRKISSESSSKFTSSSGEHSACIPCLTCPGSCLWSPSCHLPCIPHSSSPPPSPALTHPHPSEPSSPLPFIASCLNPSHVPASRLAASHLTIPHCLSSPAPRHPGNGADCSSASSEITSEIIEHSSGRGRRVSNPLAAMPLSSLYVELVGAAHQSGFASYAFRNAVEKLHARAFSSAAEHDLLLTEVRPPTDLLTSY